MSILTTIEEQLLQLARDALGNSVQQIESIGGGWTADNLQRALQFAPGVYVAFSHANRGQMNGYLDANFKVYVVSKGANDKVRRRGTARVIGAYDMLARLAYRYAGHRLTDISTLRLNGIENLFQEALFDIGGSVYAISLTVPSISFEAEAEFDSLDDFIVFDAEYSQGDAAPLAHDSVTVQEPKP